MKPRQRRLRRCHRYRQKDPGSRRQSLGVARHGRSRLQLRRHARTPIHLGRGVLTRSNRDRCANSPRELPGWGKAGDCAGDHCPNCGERCECLWTSYGFRLFLLTRGCRLLHDALARLLLVDAPESYRIEVFRYRGGNRKESAAAAPSDGTRPRLRVGLTRRRCGQQQPSRWGRPSVFAKALSGAGEGATHGHRKVTGGDTSHLTWGLAPGSPVDRLPGLLRVRGQMR
jgi:hypothetical protein